MIQKENEKNFKKSWTTSGRKKKGERRGTIGLSGLEIKRNKTNSKIQSGKYWKRVEEKTK